MTTTDEPVATSPRLPLARILNPNSVAVIGASEDTGKFGGRLLNHVMKHGYTGRIVPVNPNRSALFGIATVPSITDAGRIDVAAIAVPPDLVVRTIEECAAAGVGGVVIITAQMGEIGGEGLARERRIVAIARAAGVRIIGPNCLGFVNPRIGLAFTPSLGMQVDRLAVGAVGVISQSGALMGTMYNYGHDHGIGFSTLVSIGNQVDVTENDIFECLIADKDTRAIAVYLDGLSDAQRFLDLSDQARVAGKPVVVVKIGRSEEGRRAAFSHTASIAGPYRTFEAALRARGLVLSDDPEAAVMIADALRRWPRGLQPGTGIATSSLSGGGLGILADRISAAGLAGPSLGKDTHAALTPWLKGVREPLPLDLGALKLGGKADLAIELLETIAGDPQVGALVYAMTTQPQMLETGRGVAALAQRTGKPTLLALSAGSVAEDVRATLRSIGFPFHDRLDDVLRVLRALADYAEPSRRIPLMGDTAGLSGAADYLEAGPLTGVEAQALLAVAGVPILPSAVVITSAEAVHAARCIGLPAVAKLVSRKVAHKSDRGGVHLDLRSEAAVSDAVEQLKQSFGAEFEGALIQPFVPGVAELIVGTLWDNEFGAFIIVGSGGIFAEVFADSRILPVPVDEVSAKKALCDLRLWPALDGTRGRPAADVAAAARAIAAISRLAAALGPRLAELDVNPLILRRAGEGVAAADVRARLAPPEQKGRPAWPTRSSTNPAMELRSSPSTDRTSAMR